jgi:hypothetical protein
MRKNFKVGDVVIRHGAGNFAYHPNGTRAVIRATRGPVCETDWIVTIWQSGETTIWNEALFELESVVESPLAKALDEH